MNCEQYKFKEHDFLLLLSVQRLIIMDLGLLNYLHISWAKSGKTGQYTKHLSSLQEKAFEHPPFFLTYIYLLHRESKSDC